MPIPGFVKKRARKAVLPIGLIGGLAFLFAWILSHLGAGVGTGNGAGSEAAQSAASAATQPAGPLEVTIRGDGYWVDDSESTIDKIVAAAAGRTGPTAVRIVAGPDSRLGAERDLEKSLDQARLTWSLEAEPVAAP
jgi:hypothetical protein